MPDVDRKPPSGHLVLVHEGELNALSSPALAARVAQALGERIALIVVDLGPTTFIDSSGLGVLVAGLKQARLQGSRLALAGLGDQAQLLFRVTMAHRIFEIFPTVAEALEPSKS
jgi:anti-sigma B factor antagonist